MIKYLNDKLKLSLDRIPCANSIKNWVLKSGYSIYNESAQCFTKDDYAIITDESMMIGSEKLLLTLGVKANKFGDTAIKTKDVEILDISVKSSWNSDSISAVFTSIEDKIGKKPSYGISDNASTISKAFRKQSYKHIRDVSHTFALYIEREYKKDESFNKYTKALAEVSFKENMKTSAYLLPPKQRSIARFMNLYPLINWSQKILYEFDSLTDEEQKTFEFIKDHKSIIFELTEIMEISDEIATTLKTKGISINTALECENLISTLYQSSNDKTRRIADKMAEYLVDGIAIMQGWDYKWHCSSDIIESIFGTYKDRKSANKLNGVTTSVLMLPLLTKRNSDNGKIDLDYKNKLESVFLADLKQWQVDNLSENLMIKRRKTLKSAA